MMPVLHNELFNGVVLEKRFTMAAVVALTAVAVILNGGCNDCEEKEVASLLAPAFDESEQLTSNMVFTQIDAGISCLDSRFFEIADAWSAADVRSDYRAVSNNADYNGYVAAAMVIRSESAYLALRDKGCLDALDATRTIDWTRQTLLTVQVQSDSGCFSSSEVSVQRSGAGADRLAVAVTYTPDSDCHFEYAKTFVADTRQLQTRLSIVAGCGDSQQSDGEF